MLLSHAVYYLVLCRWKRDWSIYHRIGVVVSLSQCGVGVSVSHIFAIGKRMGKESSKRLGICNLGKCGGWSICIRVGRALCQHVVCCHTV